MASIPHSRSAFAFVSMNTIACPEDAAGARARDADVLGAAARGAGVFVASQRVRVHGVHDDADDVVLPRRDRQVLHGPSHARPAVSRDRHERVVSRESPP